MANTRNTHKQVDLRPLAAIVRKHARKSHPVGTFSYSEGYELRRTCFNDVISLHYHVAHEGSRFGAPPREDSIARRDAFMQAVTTALVAAGYAVAPVAASHVHITQVAS